MMARPRVAGVDSRIATDSDMAQNPLSAPPRSTRPSSITHIAGASATMTLDAAAMRARTVSSRRRSIRGAIRPIVGATMKPTIAVTVMVWAAWPGVIPRSAAMGERTPLGRNSAVTRTKLVAIIAMSGSSCRRSSPGDGSVETRSGSRWGRSCEVEVVMAPACERGEGGTPRSVRRTPPNVRSGASVPE